MTSKQGKDLEDLLKEANDLIDSSQYEKGALKLSEICEDALETCKEIEESLKDLQNQLRERDEYEKALDVSEKKYHQLFEVAQEGIWVIDEKSITAMVNPSMARMLGYTPEEMIGMHLFDFMDDRGKKIAQENIERRKKGIAEQHDFEFIHKKGNRIYVTIETAPLTDDAGNYTGAIAGMINITERRITELELRKFAEAIRQSAAYVVITDTLGNIEYVNPAFTEITGYTLKEVIGKNPRLLQSGEMSLSFYKNLWDTILAGKVWKGEFKNKKKNGDLYWETAVISPIKEGDRIVHFVAVKEDITDRKKAEDELKLSEARLSEAQVIAKIGNWDLDVATNSLWMSDEIYKQFGVDRKEIEITVDRFFNFIKEVDKERVKSSIDETLLNNKPYNIEFTVVRADGAEINIHSQGKVIHDNKGKAVRFFGTSHDITDRKKAEDKVETALREKEALLKELHHRTKNNMQVICSMIMLESINIEDEKTKGILDEIENKILSMSLVHEKLYQSRDLSHINLKGYIESLIDLLTESYNITKSRIKFIIDVMDIYASIDIVTPLGLVINELITNSIKHAFPDSRKGKITIELKRKEGNMLLLNYMDNGVGVPNGFDLFQCPTLGIQTVLTLIRNQLLGSIEIDARKGLHFIIEFKEILS